MVKLLFSFRDVLREPSSLELDDSVTATDVIVMKLYPTDCLSRNSTASLTGDVDGLVIKHDRRLLSHFCCGDCRLRHKTEANAKRPGPLA